MDSLKKIISLRQAAQFSGYTQDYLGYLVREGEIKGIKKGRAWFTTEEEVKNYLFKRKIQHRELAIPDFFSPTRTKNIILATIIIFVIWFLYFSFVNRNQQAPASPVQSAVTSDGEAVIIPSKN